jgi:hypothetical protein
VPRFGKGNEKDARKEELDRQAAEEVERLTRRGGPPSMGGGMGGGPGMGPPAIPSPLDRIAEELRDAPRPSMRRQAPPRRAAPQAQQAFTPMPSGSVGSSFGPGGLNPGPRGMVGAPPPPAFGGGAAYEENIGAAVTGPPVYNAEPDEDEEMSITEMALMDHAARTGHDPEDLVIQYDASTAEEMRDQAMRQFYARQQSRGPSAGTKNPFAPAGMRGGGGAAVARNLDPAAAGGALAQRLANRRRREEAEARAARGEPEPGSAPSAPAAAPVDPGDGALAKVLARRRQSLGIDEAPAPAPGRRHTEEREESSARLQAAAPQPIADEPVPTLADVAAPVTRKRPAAKKAAAKKAAAKKAAITAPAAEVTPLKKPVRKAPAKKAPKAGATLAQPAREPAPAPAPVKKMPAARKAPAKKGVPAAAAAKAVFCIECGEKNPPIAKFCFSCGTRLAAPEV